MQSFDSYHITQCLFNLPCFLELLHLSRIPKKENRW